MNIIIPLFIIYIILNIKKIYIFIMFINIRNIPIAICGLILSFFSLGNLLKKFIPFLKYICFICGLFLLILILLKLIIYPKVINNELKNPIIGSISGTFSMALMSLSLYFIDISYNISVFIWISGIIIHIILIFFFTNNFFFKNFKVENIYASIFIIYVGINNGALTSDDLGLNDIGYIIFLYGFINLIFLFPMILYRYLYYKIPEGNKPIICVFSAAVHITIKGYLNTAKHYNKYILIYYSFCFLFYLFSLYKVYEYKNIKFYPSFSAFTFSFVISAKATNGIHNRVLNNIIIKIILYFQLSFGTFIVFYIFILYLKFLIKK